MKGLPGINGSEGDVGMEGSKGQGGSKGIPGEMVGGAQHRDELSLY